MMRICLVLFISTFWLACNENKAVNTTVHPPAPAPKYYFYPKANVYFDSVNKNYVFQANDGKSWITEKQIPAVMQAMMDKSILIDTPAQPVWKDNENHRLVYSAVLYASPADTIEKKEPKPIVQKPVADDEDDSIAKKKEHKSGLRKFLEKIFGRKKKDGN